VAADISPISRVFLTQTGANTDGLRLKVKSQVESSGFEVYTKPETSTTSDLYFNWMLVN